MCILKAQLEGSSQWQQVCIQANQEDNFKVSEGNRPPAQKRNRNYEG